MYSFLSKTQDKKKKGLSVEILAVIKAQWSSAYAVPGSIPITVFFLNSVLVKFQLFTSYYNFKFILPIVRCQ